MSRISVILTAVLALAGCAGPGAYDLVNDGRNPDNILTYGMGYSQHRYSPLSQINKANVKRLVPVWSLSMENDFGEQAQPMIQDGVMYVSDAKWTVAIDAVTGKRLWRTAVEFDAATPRVVCCGVSNKGVALYHGKVIRTTIDAHVIALDQQTGELLWNYSPVANGTANIPTPIVSGDYVFGSSGYNKGSALVKIVKSGDKLEAEEVYFLQGNELQNHHGGMIRLGNHIYLGHGENNGIPVCIDMTTGKVAWRVEKSPGGASAAIAYADGHLYFRYQDATMVLIEANPKAYKLKGKFQTKTHNGDGWAHPVIAGGKLYLRDQDDLLCYDVKAK